MHVARSIRIATPDEAVELIRDGDTVLIGGSHAVPEALLAAVGRRFVADGHPRGITTIHPETPGDGDRLGLGHLAHPGLIRRLVAGAYMDAPAIAAMAARDQLEAYMLPQGVLSQLTRDMAAGRPGLITHVGLGTFVDPRHGGGRQSPSATEELVRVIELDGREFLFYRSLTANVALLRGTTADPHGNISMEREANLGEGLSQAQATHNAGGTVIVQVERVAERLPARSVRIPGILVDVVVVDPDQLQTYLRRYDPAYAGETRVPALSIDPLALSPRKVIARRAAMELRSGAVCNLGVGISTGIAQIAAEEGIADDIVLTNEQGLIGGLPAGGVDAGASTNFDAMVDQPAQFDFYDGGGLDQAFLSFGEVSRDGSVNISLLGGRLLGFGGFINISQNARSVVFSGTFTSGGLEVDWPGGRTRIANEGRRRRFVELIPQIAYNAPHGRRRGQPALYITERAVFRGGDPIELIEVAPGVDPERDVLPQMGFRPVIAADLREMDPRLFLEPPVGIQLKQGRPE
jgi:propionate CoA-transferase